MTMQRRRFGTVRHRPDRDAWFIQFTFERRQIQRRAGRTKADADRKLAAVEAALDAGRLLPAILNEVFGDVTGHRLTFRDASPMYLQYAEQNKKASTFLTDVPRLRVLNRAPWSGKFLGQITTVDLTRWAASRMSGAGAVSGSTVNRDLALASALFRWAISMGYADANPARGVRRDKERGRARTTWLTVEECDLLLAQVDASFRPSLLCLLHAGLRLGELLTLDWRSVDLSLPEIVIEPELAKTGVARHIPLTPQLADELRRMRGEKKVSSSLVFKRPDGRSWTPDSVRRGLRKVLRSCPSIPVDRKRKITPHALRHTFASHLAQQGTPLHEIAYLLGHSSTYVTARYSHLARDAGRAAILNLGQRLGQGAEPLTGGEVHDLTVPFRASRSGENVPPACPSTRLRVAS